ncbi:MAG: hypothetical protein AAFX45_08700 [Pseudomonadota bacterium]
MRLLIAVYLAVSCLSALSASAATLRVQTQIIGEGVRSIPGPSDSFNLVETRIEAAGGELNAFSVQSEDVEGPLGRASAASAANINRETGETQLIVQTSQDGAAASGATAFARISESFSLTGTGVFTVLMSVDVNWVFTSVGGGWQFQTNLCVACNSSLRDADIFLASSNAGSPLGANIDDVVISASIEVVNAMDFQVPVEWEVLADISPGRTVGAIDSTNTSIPFFETTGSLVATPSEQFFLSDPAFPSDFGDGQGGGESGGDQSGDNPAVVPLPATLPTLLVAVFGLLGLHRSKCLT